MKNLLFYLALGLLPFANPMAAQAISLNETPVTQQVRLGQPLKLQLQVSGLGNHQAPSLSTFDLDLNFDPSQLQFSNAVFGDPQLGDLLALSSPGVETATPGAAGTVNLFELSFDPSQELDTKQPDSFTLVTLIFNTKAPGTSLFQPSVNAFDDANGDPLPVEVGTATATVSPAQSVPEPDFNFLSLSLILGLGVLTVKGRGKRQRFPF